MTKKHYIKVAEILNRELKKDKDNSDIVFNIAEEMIKMFIEDSERFNPAVFKEAILKP